MKSTPRVFCADIGSVNRGSFGWAEAGREIPKATGSPEALAIQVVSVLESGDRVALGFEAPLFVPLPTNERDLGRARVNEGNRPWSAGAGAAVLGTALAQVPWILREVRAQSGRSHKLGFTRSELLNGEIDLLVWEAFVSGDAKKRIAQKYKGNSHANEALCAATEFKKGLRSTATDSHIDVGEHESFSLLAAAAMRAGWPVAKSALAGVPIAFKVTGISA